MARRAGTGPGGVRAAFRPPSEHPRGRRVVPGGELSPAERVFLTGATGLVGSHVAERLRHDGVEVHCLQRPTSDTSFLRSLGCTIVHGDVRDAPELTAERIGGCGRVVHGAALVYARLPWPKIRAVNVQGTENILRAAAIAGVSRAVHLSSVAVYGEVTRPTDENSPTDSTLRPFDLYSRSKREAEDAAMALNGDRGMGVCVLRPSGVYGERDRLFAPTLARLVRAPLTPVLGSGDVPLPVLYAGNVADAVVRALEEDAAEGKVFNLGSDQDTTQRELLAGLAKGLGEPVRFLPIPASLVRWSARAGDALGLRAPAARDLSLSRLARLTLMGDPFRSERARRELRWNPPHRAADALERTGAWLREAARGRVPADPVAAAEA